MKKQNICKKDQIEFDVILISKTDLVEDKDIDKLKAIIKTSILKPSQCLTRKRN